MRTPAGHFCFYLALLFLAPLAALAQGVITVQLDDYARAPQSGSLTNSSDNAVYVARVNFLREEPGPSLNRLFVCDLNGRLSILDKTSRQFTTYLDFQRNTAEIPGATGLFAAFTRNAGYANGLVTFQFDPEYRVAGSAHFDKFYTVHIEIDTDDGDARRLPNASAHPGFTNAAAYTPTTANEAPGTDNANTRHAVLIEWQDTHPTNAIFEGTARVPQLAGKYVFGDITTGQLFYAEVAALTAADDGNPATLARYERIELLWDNPRDAAPAQRYDRMYEIVENEYHARLRWSALTSTRCVARFGDRDVSGLGSSRSTSNHLRSVC